MKWVFLSMTWVAASVFLALEKSAGTVLRAEVEHCRLQRAELVAQHRERARLLALQPTSEERSHDWRVVVPSFAIDRLARELGASK